MIKYELTAFYHVYHFAGPKRQQHGRWQEQAIVEGQEGWQEEGVS